MIFELNAYLKLIYVHKAPIFFFIKNGAHRTSLLLVFILFFWKLRTLFNDATDRAMFATKRTRELGRSFAGVLVLLCVLKTPAAKTPCWTNTNRRTRTAPPPQPPLFTSLSLFHYVPWTHGHFPFSFALICSLVVRSTWVLLSIT